MEFKVTEAPILKSDIEIGAQIVELILDGKLEHSGVKGQKWGQRLYQNKDGSLTPLGRSRYKKMAKARAAEKANAELKSGKASFDKNGNPRTKGKGKSTSEDEESIKKTKSPADMTEAELRSEITKLQLRKQLDTLYSEMNPPKESQFKKTAGKFLNEAVVPAATEAGKNLIKNALEEKVGKSLGLSKYDTKEIKDEFDVIMKDLKEEHQKISTLKNAIQDKEWYEKYKSEQASSGNNKGDSKSSNKRTETTDNSSTADKAKTKAEEFKQKGEEFKQKGESFKKAAEQMGKDVNNEVRKSKKKKKKKNASESYEVYDKDGTYLTTINHSAFNESNIALGKALIHGELSDDELQHYGVVGMKWGVRRGNVYKAYGKAVIKREKIMDKADKYKVKSEKHLIKGGKRYITEVGRGKSEKHIRKANQLAGRSLKYQKKAEKWQKKMDKVFSDANLNKVSNELAAKGKKYLEQGKIDKNKIMNAKVDMIDMFRDSRTIDGKSKSSIQKSINQADLWAKRIDKDFNNSHKKFILKSESQFINESRRKAHNSKNEKDFTNYMLEAELHNRRRQELKRIMNKN